MNITVNASNVSRKDLVRNLQAVQAERDKLFAHLQAVDHHLGARLSSFPYKWVNKLWPLFPKKAEKKEDPNV